MEEPLRLKTDEKGGTSFVLLKNGVKSTQLFPQNESENAQFQLNFKYYQRVEQSIQLLQDTQLESIQVRVFELGAQEPKVRQSVNLS